MIYDILFIGSAGYMAASHVKAGYIPSPFHSRSHSALSKEGWFNSTQK